MLIIIFLPASYQLRPILHKSLGRLLICKGGIAGVALVASYV
jgi:hypothetical protein